MNADEPESATSSDGMNHINGVLANGPLLLEVSINRIEIEMEVDTGACKTVMHVNDFKRHFGSMKLSHCDRRLFSVSRQQLDIVGSCMVSVRKGKSNAELYRCLMTVVDGPRGFIPLLGRDWLDELYPQ